MSKKRKCLSFEKALKEYLPVDLIKEEIEKSNSLWKYLACGQVFGNKTSYCMQSMCKPCEERRIKKEATDKFNNDFLGYLKE